MGGTKENGAATKSEPEGRPVPLGERQADAIYQFDRFGREQRPVARVVEPEVDEAAAEIRFGEIYQSDELVLSDECEFRQYRLLVKKIAYAAKLDKEAPHKGRVLRGVTARLLGRREQ
jgi:hypothetical protein